MAAQDQSELFDVVDRDGTPLGIRKARGLVHRDGDWHRSVHVWVLVEGERPNERGAPWVLFQQRSPQKDTWPGAIDVAVTGHYRAGERLAEALREAEEEIGLPLAQSDVTRIGLRRCVNDRRPALLDREVQDILLAMTQRPLAALRPDPEEVTALIALPLDQTRSLVCREIDAAHGLVRRAPSASGVTEIAPFAARLADFVGAHDGYYERAVDAICRRLAGEDAPAWILG